LLKPIKKQLVLLTHMQKTRANSKTISSFAKKIGLVYFGSVNQHLDEHKIIRGLTVSSTHMDSSYCVGTFEGYSLSVVDRKDYSVEPDGTEILNNWIIFAFELHNETAVPHFFIGTNNHDIRPFHSLFSTFPNMKEIDLSEFVDYGDDFTTRFSIFARPAKTIEVLDIISADIAKVVAAHFWPLSVEQHDNVLYIYSTFEKVNSALLDKMLKNGHWLAVQIDSITNN